MSSRCRGCTVVVVTVTVLSHFSFPPWYWLNTEKYVLLDKLKAIKSIPYMEQEVQNSWAGNTNWKLQKSPRIKEPCQGTTPGKMPLVHALGKFPGYHKQ